jgi:hypothetical protein
MRELVADALRDRASRFRRSKSGVFGSAVSKPRS